MRKLFFLVVLALLSPSVRAASTGNETITINGVTYHKGYKEAHQKGATYFHPAPRDIPSSYDAVAAGMATPVKGTDGQGSCGDCWAWSRTSALEAASILAGAQPKTVNLSEEDTTDNASDEDGCGGGSMDFNYEINHGVSSTATCPWEGGGGSCQSVPLVQGYKMAYIGDSNGPTDAELMAAIYQFGSVSVTVAAGGNFSPDGNDQITDCGSSSIDHMVSLVGYKPGATAGSVLYKMKNSWGTTWGDFGGYAYLALGCDAIATGDQSAMVVYVPTVIPPVPVLDLQLPIEILAAPGTEVPIQVPTQDTATLGWSDGESGAVIWVKPAQTTAYTLTATDAAGNKTTSTVNVIISLEKKG